MFSREHADAELREQLLGKSENDNTSFPIVLDDDSDISMYKAKDEHPEELLPVGFSTGVC